MRRRKTFIVNLQQRVSFMPNLSEIVPCLMTSSSVLYSMRMQRLLHPLEHLCVQGIPIFDSRRAPSDLFAVEKLALSGRLTSSQVKAVAGNGMNLLAVGSVIMFVLGTVEMNRLAPSPISVKASEAEAEDEPEEDDRASDSLFDFYSGVEMTLSKADVAVGSNS